MNIEEIRNQITQNQNEINRLNDLRGQLEEVRSTMSEEEYNRELADINRHLETEQARLEENQRINNSYTTMVASLNAINDIRSIPPRDDEEREEMESEIRARQEEVRRVSENLPDELRTQARNEVLQRNENRQTQNNQSDSSIQEPTIQEQTETTRREMLDKEVINSQQEIRHLDEMMRQLESVRNFLSEAEYNREHENISKYIERATNKLKEQNQIMTAYDKMLENIRKLNALSEVVPRDDQDRDQIAEEKERREEEIKHARETLPAEYQEEIRNRIIKEQEEKKNKKNNVTSKQPTPSEEKKLPALPPAKEKDLPFLPTEASSTKKRIRTADESLAFIETGEDGKQIKMSNKTGQRLEAANIKVTKAFKEELHSGNWLYNVVHFAPAVVGFVIKGAKKIIAKFNLWRKNEQNVKEQIRARIDQLSPEELKLLREKFKGNKLNEYTHIPTAVQNALREKFAEEDRKTVAEINQKISANYQTLLATFNGVQAINKQLENQSLSAKRRQALTAQKSALLKGKAALVRETRELYDEGNDIISHGYDEDLRASQSKMNRQGKRFAKSPEYNEASYVLQQNLAIISRREEDACEAHNDEAALRAFVACEMLKSQETEICNSIFGRRSTGRMYYSPLVGELDYRDDPFIRDLFSTVALVGAGISAANAIRTHMVETSKAVSEHNAQLQAANAHNQEAISQAQQTGQDIYDKSDVFRKGQEAQTQQTVVNYGNTGERMSLDSSAIETGGDWGRGLGSSYYKNLDDAQHAMTESIYNETQAKISDIGSRYATGELDQLSALKEVGKVAAESQQTLTNLVDQYRPILEQYASTHPQFELDAMQSGLEFISQNPTAITDMNQAMVDTVNMGQSLTGLTVEQVHALQSLPSDLETTLIGAATAAGLACKTATTLNQKYARKTIYGNDLTDMVEDFVENQEQQETASMKKAA